MRTFGWSVELFYLALPDVSLSKKRVAERVAHGGHDIPVADIERRFPRSLHNLLTSYRMRVDKCVCFMNDDDRVDKVFVQCGDDLVVVNQALYDHISRLSGLTT